MRYTVTWRTEVEDDLASIWITAMDQQAFADAVDALERQLKHDPFLHAVDVGNNTWAMTCGSLRLQYRVREDDAAVDVLRIDLLDLP